MRRSIAWPGGPLVLALAFGAAPACLHLPEEPDFAAYYADLDAAEAEVAGGGAGDAGGDVDAAPETVAPVEEVAGDDAALSDAAPDTAGPEELVGDDAFDASDVEDAADAAVDAEPDACQPACDGKQCGEDGCGGVCGACTMAEACNDTGQCEPLSCPPGSDGQPCELDGDSCTWDVCDAGTCTHPARADGVLAPGQLLRAAAALGPTRYALGGQVLLAPEGPSEAYLGVLAAGGAPPAAVSLPIPGALGVSGLVSAGGGGAIAVADVPNPAVGAADGAMAILDAGGGVADWLDPSPEASAELFAVWPLVGGAGAVLAGAIFNPADSRFDGWAVYAPPEGEGWTSTLEGAGESGLRGLVALPGGDFLGVGERSPGAGDPGEAWWVRLDVNGGLVDQGTLYPGRLSDLVALADGGAAATGRRSGAPDDAGAVFVRFDASGQILADKTLPDGPDRSGRRIVRLGATGSLLAADTAPGDGTDPATLLMALDTSGSLIGEPSAFGPDELEPGPGLAATEEGGVLVVGSRRHADPEGLGIGRWLWLDAEGQRCNPPAGP